jgi:hypothetical protein
MATRDREAPKSAFSHRVTAGTPVAQEAGVLRPLVLVFVVSVLMSPSAHAQPGKPAPAAVAKVPSRKSPGFAVGLSLGVTAGAIAIAAVSNGGKGGLAIGSAGLLVGPSTGLWYAGKVASVGTGVRVAGTTALLGGLVWAAGCHDVILDEQGQFLGHEDDDCSGPGAVVAMGAVAMLAGTIWEIVDAHDTAREHNRRLDLAVAPTVMPTGRGVSPGLALTARF